MNLFKKISKSLFKVYRNFKQEDEIRREIEKLRREGINKQNVLNQEAIWLFLAFISVWSLPTSPLIILRVIVSMLLLAIFFNRIETEKKKSNRTDSFPKIISQIEEQIKASNFNERSKKALFYDLNNARDEIIGKSAKKNTWVFQLCFCCCMISLWFFADTALVSIQNRLIQYLQ
ncbi:MAG: hypothetical protein AAFQ14_12170 [Cyanobacteria bacterium J06621_12]